MCVGGGGGCDLDENSSKVRGMSMSDDFPALERAKCFYKKKKKKQQAVLSKLPSEEW